MILDKEVVFALNQAFGDAAGDAIDLESISANGAVGPGPGNPIKCFAQGNGLTGATGIYVEHGDTSTTANHMEILSASVVNDLVEFELPSDIKQFVRVGILGTLSAGTWSAGIILPGAQTAK